MATAENKIPKIRKVEIDDLKRDFTFYPRECVDYQTVSRFMDAMRSGCKFPPLKICSKTGRIIDGFHRFGAYQQLGTKEVDAIGIEIENDAHFFLLAIEANKAHGLGYSQADQYKIVKLAARLGLEREKISLAVALPIQKVVEMMRNVPSFTSDDKPKPVHMPSYGGSVKSQPATIRPIAPKANAITSSGFLFYCRQVIRYMQSDLCDVGNETILATLRELQSCLTSQLDPNKLKDLICEKVKEGAVTFADLSIELSIPESQVKAMVEELKATGRIHQGKQQGRKEGQKGDMREHLFVAGDEPANPTPRDNRISHPALQAFKAATGRYPNKLLFDRVIEALGDFPDVTRLNDVFVAWVGRGYNPQNLNWLDWYAEGIPENANGKNKPQRESASQRNVRNLKDSLAYLSGVQGDSREIDPKVETRLLPPGS